MSSNNSSAPAGAGVQHLIRFNTVLSRVMSYIATIFSLVFIVLTLVEIISRSWLDYSSVWAGEVATLSFVWSLFLGAAVCFRSNAHLVVDLFNAERGTLLDNTLRTLNFICTLAFALIFTYLGAKLIARGFERTTPMLGLPMVYGWSAPWVMGVTMITFAIEEYLAPGHVEAGLLPPSAV